MITVPVCLGERSYEVLVGPGVRSELASLIPQGARRAAVVTQEGLEIEVDAGIEARVFRIGAGEGSKSMRSVEELCSGFARWGLTRSDVIVSVGGGLVTDVGGFAAAIYHRGTAVAHVPTTLLAQIDAAIGGKTGVNLPEGKNLVGAFWQPIGVLCDTELLATLPERELRSGLGELAKYHFIGGGGLDGLTLEQQVARCVEVKAEVVSSDEREGGRRAILNYGHTLGHAIEVAGGFGLRHGEAVAIGLVYAAELAHRLGRIGAERVAEHRRVVAGYDLPSSLPSELGDDSLMDLLRRDKKAREGLTFVLDGPRGVEVVEQVDEEIIRSTFETVREAP